MPLVDLVDSHEFRTGLAAGVVALLVVFVVVVLARRSGWRRRDPVPVAGIALVVASLIALGDAGGGVAVSARLVAGLALLALGALVATLRRSWMITTLATLPGAALVAWAASLENDVSWVPPFVFVATVIGGALVADFDRANARAGLGPVLIAVTALATYTAVPDTEQIATVVGVALPIALLGAPRAMACLGGPAAFSSVGLLMWVAAVGGRGRPGAVVGAVACLGVMLVEPIVRRARPGLRCSSPETPISPRAILVVVLDLGLVAGTSRIAGLETSGGLAAVISVVALGMAGVVLTVVLAPWTPREPASRPPQTRRRQ